jgi:ABC-type cobalamin transport system ATPase subunit
MPRPENSYDTGYKKPPAAHRFKPGQSGNPNGRKKATKNLNQILQDELSRMVKVREGERTTAIPVYQAAVRTLFSQGISKGKITALNRILQMAEEAGNLQQEEAEAAQLANTEEARQKAQQQQEYYQRLIFDFLNFIADARREGRDVTEQGENLQKLLDSCKN